MRTALFVFFAVISVFLGKEGQAAEDFGPYTEVNVNVGDATLFCRTMGQGDPLIVIHGGPGLTQDYLLPGMAKLSENNFVIFYDQRGCGESAGEVNAKSININNYLSDLDAIRTHFGYEKVAILGHSWGGFIAMEYAIAYPEAVKKMILSNSIPASSEGFALFMDEWFQRMVPYLEEISVIQASPEFKEGKPGMVEQYYRTMFRTYCYDPDKAELLNLKMSPKAFLNGLKVNEIFTNDLFFKPFDLYLSLKKLKVPTLVLHGDADIVPFSTAEQTYQSIPSSEYILIQDCGHFPYVEDPYTYFNHIRNFLKG